MEKSKIRAFFESILSDIAASILTTALFNVLPQSVRDVATQLFSSSILVTSIFIFIFTFLLFNYIKTNILYYVVYVDKQIIEREYEFYYYTMFYVTRELIQCQIHYRYKSFSAIDTDTFIFKWTGNDYTIEILSEGYSLNKIEKTDDYERYLVIFPRKIQKNQSVELKFNLKLYDKNQTAVPIMQYNVNHPLKKLKMELRFSGSIELEHVCRQCFIGNSNYATQSEDCDASESEYLLCEEKPLFLHKYCLNWKYRI